MLLYDAALLLQQRRPIRYISFRGLKLVWAQYKCSSAMNARTQCGHAASVSAINPLQRQCNSVWKPSPYELILFSAQHAMAGRDRTARLSDFDASLACLFISAITPLQCQHIKHCSLPPFPFLFICRLRMEWPEVLPHAVLVRQARPVVLTVRHKRGHGGCTYASAHVQDAFSDAAGHNAAFGRQWMRSRHGAVWRYAALKWFFSPCSNVYLYTPLNEQMVSL